MSKRTLLTLALHASLALPASHAEEAVDLEMVTRIRDEGLSNSKVMETAGRLANPVFRLAGLRPEALPLSTLWIPRGGREIRRRMSGVVGRCRIRQSGKPGA